MVVLNIILVHLSTSMFTCTHYFLSPPHRHTHTQESGCTFCHMRCSTHTMVSLSTLPGNVPDKQLTHKCLFHGQPPPFLLSFPLASLLLPFLTPFSIPFTLPPSPLLLPLSLPLPFSFLSPSPLPLLLRLSLPSSPSPPSRSPSSDDYTLQISPESGTYNENHLDYFRFTGRICGMAVYHNRLIDGEGVRL